MENSNNVRIGEKRISLYRSGRFYSVSNEWYFSVRETTDQGPYPSKSVAEEQLKLYIADQELFTEKKIFKLKLVEN